jgi:hypothetical protein
MEINLNTQNPQAAYNAALARIGAIEGARNGKRCTPIFQRDAASSEKQALKDAATALRAIWKRQQGK